jgi:TM2 domain-containing membrane protein YozV
MIPVVLSILIPGLGQIYYGKTARGIIMILMTLVPLLYPIALVWSIVDAVRLARTGSNPAFSRRQAIAVIVFVFLIVPLGVLLAWTAMWSVSGLYSKFVKRDDAVYELTQIKAGLLKYKEAKGVFPTSMHELAGRRLGRQQWLHDPWGEEYHFTVADDSTTCVVVSKGPDRERGTGDDLER